MPTDNRAPLRASRFPPLEPNLVKFKKHAHSNGLDVSGWVAFSNIYPAYAVVQWPPQEPFEHMRMWEGGGKPPTYRTQTIVFRGWGTVTLSAVINHDTKRADLASLTQLDPRVGTELTSLEAGTPIGWEWVPQLELGNLLFRRCRAMLMGLAVYAYRSDPKLWGEHSQMLDVWAEQWRYVDGVPITCDKIGLDLRDPTTWNF